MANFIFFMRCSNMDVISSFHIKSGKIKPLNFRGQNSTKEICKNKKDCFVRKYDYVLCSQNNKFGELDYVDFKMPITPAKAVLSLLYSSDKNITDALLYKMHTPDELELMSLDVASDDYLSTLKVKKMVGLGAKAFVFELDDGKILKLTNGSHFPNKRKPDFFDVPIIKQGRSCRTYYYIEEKMNQKEITQEELKKFIKQIEEKGYTFRDHFYSDEKSKKNPQIRIEQFGKSKDGKLYLLDPECAIAIKKQFSAIKTIKGKLIKIFAAVSLFK